MKVTVRIPDDLMEDVMKITGTNRTETLKETLEFFLQAHNSNEIVDKLKKNNLDIDSLSKDELKILMKNFLHHLHSILTNKIINK